MENGGLQGPLGGEDLVGPGLQVGEDIEVPGKEVGDQCDLMFVTPHE